jgi:hypothetical protein
MEGQSPHKNIFSLPSQRRAKRETMWKEEEIGDFIYRFLKK